MADWTSHPRPTADWTIPLSLALARAGYFAPELAAVQGETEGVIDRAKRMLAAIKDRLDKAVGVQAYTEWSAPYRRASAAIASGAEKALAAAKDAPATVRKALATVASTAWGYAAGPIVVALGVYYLWTTRGRR